MQKNYFVYNPDGISQMLIGLFDNIDAKLEYHCLEDRGDDCSENSEYIIDHKVRRGLTRCRVAENSMGPRYNFMPALSPTLKNQLNLCKYCAKLHIFCILPLLSWKPRGPTSKEKVIKNKAPSF